MKRMWPALLILVMAWEGLWADGKTFSSRDGQTYSPLVENEQRAVIALKDKTEHLILAISLDLENDENAAWIFPLLGEPNQIKLSLIDRYPVFDGYDPRSFALDILEMFNFSACATQIWPVPVSSMLTMAGNGIVKSGAAADAWGLHGEVVSADSLPELHRYLANNNISVPFEELSAFKDYFGKAYSFVIVRVASKASVQKEFDQFLKTRSIKERCPCVYVQFPAEKPFFPLKPTNYYDKGFMRISVTAIGTWRSGLAIPRYFKQENLDFNLPPDFKVAIEQENVRYTLFSWIAMAGTLKNDMVLVPVEVKGWVYGEFWYRMPMWGRGLVFLVFLVSMSYISGGLMGVFALKSWRAGAMLGLWNILSIVALAFAVKYSSATVQIRKSMWKYLMFVADFSILFVFLTTIVIGIVRLPIENEPFYIIENLLVNLAGFILAAVLVAVAMLLRAAGRFIIKKALR